jgi:spermidine synthase
MDLWYSEYQTERLRIGFKIRETLHRVRTAYQDLLILDTYEYGRMMVLDGMVMLSDYDEFAYHEMIVHVPMCLHPNPKSVLVVGGGDGGSVREVLRHPSVERVVMCEIDEEVVNASRKYFPRISCKLDDPKVELMIRDAVEYVKNPGETFDVAIIDSTDPIGPSLGLFTPSFYRNLYQCLGKDGIAAAQSESFYLHPNHVRDIYKKYKQLFPHVAVYCSNIPTYPTGYWAFTLGSKTKDPLKDWSRERARKLELELRYYNADIHQSAFALPNMFREWLNV